jgi:hypothetical protein
LNDDVRVLTCAGAALTWPVIARIWQTVDVDRTVANLGLTPETLPVDDVLGGQGVVVPGPDGVPLVILEPSTEGPLAESLARHGEGDTGVYVAPPGGLAAARRVGLTLYREATGPFGREALVRMQAGSQTAPFTVIVDRPPDTIEP